MAEENDQPTFNYNQPLTPNEGDDNFDVGFQAPDYMQAESQIGQIASHYEDQSQSLYNQANAGLMKAQTDLSITQSNLTNGVAKAIETAKQQLTNINNDIEVQAAGSLGAIAVKANAIIPNDPAIQALAVAQAGYPNGDAKSPDGQPVIFCASSLDQCSPKVYTVLSAYDCDYVSQFADSIKPIMYIQRVFSSDPKFLVAVYIKRTPPGNGNLFYFTFSPPGSAEWPDDVMGYLCPAGIGTPPTPPPIPKPPYPPQPQPTPPVPCPPSNCPKVELKFPECIKFCEEKPKECPPPKYKVYCGVEDNVYIIEDDKPPQNPKDKLIGSGTVTEINWKSVCECGATKPPPETDNPVPIGPISGATGIGCGEIVMARTIEVGEAADIIRFVTAGFTEEIRTAGWSVDSIAASLVKTVLTIFNVSLGAAYNALATLVGSLFTKAGCNPAALTTTFFTKCVTTLVSYVAGDTLAAQDTEATYYNNSNCQYLLPSIAEAIGGYIRNVYTYDQTVCLIKANGGRMDLYGQQIEAARSRLTALETIMAYRREIITKQQATTNLRELGYYYPAEQDVLYQLTEQIPTISDLLPMMVRDVADEVNVDWSESDKIFGQKWTGQIKKWGDMQGITPEWAKFAWRYHWQLPSPTQLFEFYARLRHSGKFGTPDEFKEKIRKTLIQQDILPEWVDKYLEIANKPLTRIDSRRAFEIGAIGEETLKQAYLDLGYSDNNARILTDYNKQLVTIQRTKNPLIGQYVSGELTMDDLYNELKIQGLPHDAIQTVQDAALRRAKYKRRKTCIQSYKRRYMTGELTIEYVKQLLIGEGLQVAQVSEITEAWQCERSARGKEIPAGTLAGWYQDGIITDSIFYKRLKNLGYNADDAAKLVGDARYKLGVRTQKDELARIAKMQREEKANQRLAKQLAKEAEANESKAAARAEKMNARRAARKRLVIKAADTIAKRTESDIADAVLGVQRSIDDAIAAGIGAIDNIYSAAVEVSTDENVITPEDFRAELFRLVLSLESSP